MDNRLFNFEQPNGLVIADVESLQPVYISCLKMLSVVSSAKDFNKKGQI